MERRQFLKTVGAAGPAVAAGGSVSGRGGEEHLSSHRPEPKVFMFDDGRHAGGLYQFEPPLTAADHAYNVDQLADTGVDTLVYFAGVEGGTALYDSRVCQLWGDAVDRWTHYVWYRAWQILRQMIADGMDPLQVLCERAREVGIWMLASSWVSLQGGRREVQGGLGRWSEFAMDHPEFEVGEDPDPRAKHLSPQRFNFLHKEVREERFRVFEELLKHYPTDGIELNLVWDYPFCRFDRIDELRPVMTHWIRRLREVAEEAEREQGRRKRIYARIPAHPEAWKMVGYDVETWISGGLVDGLICVASHSGNEHVNQDLDLKRVVELTRGSRCRVLACFNTTLRGPRHHYATAPMIWAAAANAYHQGADGFGIGDHHWTPHGWPWTGDNYETLRLLGRPEYLATADKHYHVESHSTERNPYSWIAGGIPPLPRELKEGEPAEISLRIADDLARWERLDRIRSVRLRIRLVGYSPNHDKVEIRLNGTLLPEATADKTDLTYRLMSTGGGGPYGYIFEYRLEGGNYPPPGPSRMTVTLKKKDRRLALPLVVYHVDCSIRYRLHRSFESDPIEY